MLVTIAVIGIITVIAIPLTSRINDAAKKAYARKNAQQAASISMAANAAGIVHVVPDVAGGVEATLEVLSNGIATTSGFDPPLTFQLNIASGDIPLTAEYLALRYSDSEISMEYNPGE